MDLVPLTITDWYERSEKGKCDQLMLATLPLIRAVVSKFIKANPHIHYIGSDIQSHAVLAVLAMLSKDHFWEADYPSEDIPNIIAACAKRAAMKETKRMQCKFPEYVEIFEGTAIYENFEPEVMALIDELHECCRDRLDKQIVDHVMNGETIRSTARLLGRTKWCVSTRLERMRKILVARGNYDEFSCVY